MTNETNETMTIPDPTQPEANIWPDSEESWEDFGKRLAREARAINPRVVFIGDSITQGWSGEGIDSWNARFAELPAANLGIGGDRTQNLLWRIDDGAFTDLDPDLVVLKIGVNNLWTEVQVCGSERVSEGIQAVVGAISEVCPSAKILVLGVLPTGQSANDPLRRYVSEVNAITAKTVPTSDGRVSFVDIGESFVEPGGTISAKIMPDFCHLSPQGYETFADVIEPLIAARLAQI